jgi:hypothetical protein
MQVPQQRVQQNVRRHSEQMPLQEFDEVDEQFEEDYDENDRKGNQDACN